MALGSDGQAAAHNQPPSGREESQRQKRRSLDRDVRSGCNRAPFCTPFGQKRTALARKEGILRRHRSRYAMCRERRPRSAKGIAAPAARMVRAAGMI